jgi:hypothetical protein
MKRLAAAVSLAGCLVLALNATAPAINHVTVESKTVSAGFPATIGVFVTNDEDIRHFYLPLKLHTVGGESYITSLRITPNPTGRFHGRLNDILIYDGYETPDGVCLTTPPNVGFRTTWSGVDGIPGSGDEMIDAPNPPMPVSSSPAALKISRGRVISALTLPPGADGATPSFMLDVTVNQSSPGSFEVDTTCTDPAGHLFFARTTGTPPSIIPTFSKGVITVVACECGHQGDVNQDGVFDVFDVVGLIDHVFSGYVQPPKDPLCPHVDRGDVNCDGVDDVFDVVQLIEFIFSGGHTPCEPCLCTPYPTVCP